MQKSHRLLGCHAVGINSSLMFFKSFAFFKFNMPSKKSDNIFKTDIKAVPTREKILDKKAVLIRLKIKNNMLDKRAFLK